MALWMWRIGPPVRSIALQTFEKKNPPKYCVALPLRDALNPTPRDSIPMEKDSIPMEKDFGSYETGPW